MVEREPASLKESRIAVSLSGGGYRAAAFGAGALLYLADADLMEQVCMIASVSGGSITNAFGAAHIFSEDAGARSKHWERASALLEALAQRDLIPIFPIVVRFVVGPAFLLFAAVASVHALLSGRVLGTLVAALVGGLLLVPLFYSAYKRLNLYAMLRLGGWLTACQGEERMAPLRKRLKLLLKWLGFVYTLRFRKAADVFAALRRGDVVHLQDLRCTYRPVFCTTDLVGGSHFYISDRFVGGIGAPLRTLEVPRTPDAVVNLVGAAPRMPLARAVVASAAFPAAFQPILENSSELGLPHRAGVVPRMIRLADGGLHDNLGFTLSKLWHADALDAALLDVLGAPPDVYFVVNSSAPGFGWAQRGLLRTLWRSIDVLHQANGQARREQVLAFLDGDGVGGSLVEIGEDPYEIADTSVEPEWREAIRGALETLEENGHQLSRCWWRAASREWSQSVKTNVKALGAEETARLVLHGYMAMLAHTTAQFGVRVPSVLPSMDGLKRCCKGMPPPVPMSSERRTATGRAA